MNLIRKLIVTGLGTGYLWPPGTWGSLGACGAFLAVAAGSGGRWHCVSGSMLVLAAAATFGCVVLGRFAEEAFGRKDPGRCTLDEWAGQALTFVLLPTGAGWSDWLKVAAAGFVMFRALDILKPPPIRSLQKLTHGWGIVLDDLAAGVLANIICQLILRLGFRL